MRGRAWLVTELAIGFTLVAAFVVLAAAMMALPDEPTGLTGRVQAQLHETGLSNMVNAVLLDFRALDTLLETGVLVLALAGLWALSTDEAWQGAPANFRSSQTVEPPLVVLLKVLVPLALMAAFYLLWLGADEPGGAFQAGTIVAAIGILLVLARAMPAPSPTALATRCTMASGLLVFAGIGLLTLVFGYGMLDYPQAWAKSLILLIEFALTVTIAATLFMLASGLPEQPEASRRP